MLANGLRTVQALHLPDTNPTHIVTAVKTNPFRKVDLHNTKVDNTAPPTLVAM